MGGCKCGNCTNVGVVYLGSCKLAGCVKAAVVKGLYERGYTKGGLCGNVDSKRCFKMHMKYNQKNMFIYPF